MWVVRLDLRRFGSSMVKLSNHKEAPYAKQEAEKAIFLSSPLGDSFSGNPGLGAGDSRSFFNFSGLKIDFVLHEPREARLSCIINP